MEPPISRDCLPFDSLPFPWQSSSGHFLPKLTGGSLLLKGERAAACIPRILGTSPKSTTHVYQDPGGSSPVHIDFQGYIWLCFVFGQWREYQVNVLCSDA